jgi:arsenical pump membrane protein
VLMALSSFWDLPLWIISGVSALVLFLFCCVYLLFKKKDAPMLVSSIKRLPYTVIPFVLSMFAIVMALKGSGLISAFSNWLSGMNPIWSYGVSSFLFCDFINNIPMSVLFTEVIRAGGSGIKAVYASIIGSNIGAFLTPVGALAGVMWMSILKNHGIRFTFIDFVKYGVLIAVPTMTVALLGLYL